MLPFGGGTGMQGGAEMGMGMYQSPQIAMVQVQQGSAADMAQYLQPQVAYQAQSHGQGFGSPFGHGQPQGMHGYQALTSPAGQQEVYIAQEDAYPLAMSQSAYNAPGGTSMGHVAVSQNPGAYGASYAHDRYDMRDHQPHYSEQRYQQVQDQNYMRAAQLQQQQLEEQQRLEEEQRRLEAEQERIRAEKRQREEERLAKEEAERMHRERLLQQQQQQMYYMQGQGSMHDRMHHYQHREQTQHDQMVQLQQEQMILQQQQQHGRQRQDEEMLLRQQEKHAERERKAAEKQAERERREAEKAAERERKEQEKAAEKERRRLEKEQRKREEAMRKQQEKEAEQHRKALEREQQQQQQLDAQRYKQQQQHAANMQQGHYQVHGGQGPAQHGMQPEQHHQRFDTRYDAADQLPDDAAVPPEQYAEFVQGGMPGGYGSFGAAMAGQPMQWQGSEPHKLQLAPMQHGGLVEEGMVDDGGRGWQQQRQQHIQEQEGVGQPAAAKKARVEQGHGQGSAEQGWGGRGEGGRSVWSQAVAAGDAMLAAMQGAQGGQSMAGSGAVEAGAGGLKATMQPQEVMAASHALERAGGVVHAMALVEGYLGVSASISPMEGVRLRLRLVDLYERYTDRREAIRVKLQEAVHGIERQGRSARANAMRVAIHLRLALLFGEEGANLDGAWREVQQAKRIVQDSALVEEEGWLHLVQFHLAAAAGDTDGADRELMETARVACGGTGEGFSELGAMAKLLRAHLQLRGGEPGMATEALQRAGEELARAEGAGGGRAGQLAELREYHLVLCLNRDLMAGDFRGSHGMLGQLDAVREQLRAEGALGEGGGALRRQHLLWWRSDVACIAVRGYFRSLVLPGMEVGVHQGGESSGKGSGLIKAVREVYHGLAVLDGKMESKGAGGGGEGEVDTVKEGVQEGGKGAVGLSRRERASLRLLLLERVGTLCLALGDYANALKAICGMIQCIEQGMRPGAAGGAQGDLVTRECMASVHISIACYLDRVGDIAATLSHLRAVEALAPSRHVALCAMLLRALALLDSSDVAGGAGDEMSLGDSVLQEAIEMSAEFEVGNWARAAILFLRARCLLKGSSGHDLDHTERAKDLLTEALDIVDGPLGDVQLTVKVMTLMGDALLTLGFTEEALGCMGQAHNKVTSVGDIWLELRVLRGLERCYLRLPDRFRVAKASLTVKHSREKKVAEAVKNATTTKQHQVVLNWRADERGWGAGGGQAGFG